jgi:hypothetical protein
MALTRRDGANFSAEIGAGFAPVTDERRHPAPKGARRFPVAL